MFRNFLYTLKSLFLCFMNFFIRISLKVFFILLFYFLILPDSLSAGSYYLTPSNYNSSSSWCENCVDLDSNVSVNPTAFTMASGASSAVITLKTVKIHQGQDWTTLSFTWSGQNSDSISISINNSIGDVLLNKTYTTNSVGSQSFSLASLKTKSGGLNLTIVVTLNSSSSTAALESMKVSYSSDSLILFPSPYNPAQGKATVKIDMEKAAVVTISIYDSRYYLVKTIISNKSISAYDTPLAGYKKTWTGKDNNGNDLPSGVYTIIAKIQKSGGEKKTLIFRFLMIR